MTTLTLYLDGVGLWSPALADFDAAKAQARGEAVTPPPSRPAAATLPANERRRAPESVLLAVEVAGQAVGMSGRAANELPCIFSSTYGDQLISDYMCATLAQAPAELSPTRFHNSVHNAPAGYWTIATGCHASSSAVSAGHASFGAGLLEAATLALAERRAVLLVASDIAGHGPVGEMSDTRVSFGCALVLSPTPSSHTLAQLRLDLVAAHDARHPAPASGAWHEGNPMAASAWPLMQNLVKGEGECQLAAADTLALKVSLEKFA